MNVRLMLFAGLRQRAGTDQLNIQLPSGATVAQLRGHLAREVPELAGPLEACRFAVNCEFADDNTPVPPDAEVAVIPPVSGGHDGTELRADHCRLTDKPLELGQVLAAVEHADAGGVTSFVGNVRRHSRGKVVEYLEYEAYAPMAVREMESIARALEQRHIGVRVCIHHRIGRLEIGEAAVMIAASAPHRAEAFSLCREAIEALKANVPIWKREVDEHGGAWIGQGP
ncbi:MAG: molybdopterin converting factor subunit 1 [Myxococcales bacterium FL481]|nr:MAG: molybdopterin converting factor subunit 1 [Myxococcales bacterium FL481]